MPCVAVYYRSGVSPLDTSTWIAPPARAVSYVSQRNSVLATRKERWMYTQGKRGHLWMFIGWLALTGMGCTHLISETLRQQAQPSVSFAELRTNPEALKGRTVILGGEILQTTNLRDGTRIEVLQRPLSESETPKLTDTSGGRFMAFCKEYLDPAIYAQQRRITVAGQVLGTFSGKVGEVDYPY